MRGGKVVVVVVDEVVDVVVGDVGPRGLVVVLAFVSCVVVVEDVVVVEEEDVDETD